MGWDEMDWVGMVMVMVMAKRWAETARISRRHGLKRVRRRWM